LRDGNDQLQSEANNAFSPRVFNDPSKIFWVGIESEAKSSSQWL
jgi:hypothetical protein